MQGSQRGAARQLDDAQNSGVLDRLKFQFQTRTLNNPTGGGLIHVNADWLPSQFTFFNQAPLVQRKNMSKIKVEATVVRALFNYADHSEDGRLSFAKGDVIEVLKQEASGWWDGVVNGKRGWFPSNYVTAPEQVRISPKKTYGWVRRIAKDGVLQMYYNTLTGDTVPFAEDEIPRLTVGVKHLGDFSDPRSPDSPVITRNDSGFASNENMPLTFQKEQVPAVKMPANWGVKMTADGRTYYYNMLTNETTWNLSDINHQSAISATTTKDTSPAASIKNLRLNEEQEKKMPAVLLNTWEGLRKEVINKITRLKEAAIAKEKSKYLIEASAVVQAIHYMMVVSDTLEKSSPALKGNRMLSIHHRHIMKSLSKLVLSSKQAAGVWPAPDALFIMSSDANEVLLAVRHFSTQAEDLGISITEPRASPMDTGAASRPPSIYSEAADSNAKAGPRLTNVEIIAGIDSAPPIITEAIMSLHQAIQEKNLAKNSSEIISGTRRIVTEVGQLLSLIEELDSSALSAGVVAEFDKNKQNLYNSITSLVSSTTSAVDPMEPVDALDQVLESSAKVERNVVDLVISAKYVLEEKVAIDQMSLQMDVDRDRRNSDASFTPRRALSMTNVVHDDRDNAKSETDIFNLEIDTNVVRSQTTVQSAPITSVTPDEHPRRYDTLKTAKNRLAAASAPVRRITNNTGIDSSRLQKIFGEEFVDDSASNGENWFLAPDHSDRDVLYSMEGALKGATLPVLIEKITSHEIYDVNLTQAFLLTYRSFTTAREVFNMLAKRYSIEAPPGLTEQQQKTWTEKKQKPVRLRVFNIMKIWIDSFLYDDDDYALMPEFRKFALFTVKESMPLACEQLLKQLERRKSGKEVNIRRINIVSPRDPPPPILPRNLKRIRLFDVDPLELARQITVMESKLFCEVQPSEFLNKAWSDKENNLAPHIKKMIDSTNQMTGWVAESILLEKDIKKRCSVMKYFIIVGEKCRQLKNFNALMAILAALNSSQIHRLKRTRELLSAKTKAILEESKEVMAPNQNFSNYRNELRVVDSPCVPFLGMYLTDLTFIEDGNSDRVKAMPHLINFDKRLKTADKVKEIQQYQQPYPVMEVPELQTYLASCLKNADRDPEQMYQKSLQIEPREREDEKIARLLLESGFL